MIRYVFAFLASLSLASVASSAGLSSKEELDAEVREAIEALYKHSSAAKELAGKASGMLVFPKVVKGGVVELWGTVMDDRERRACVVAMPNIGPQSSWVELLQVNLLGVFRCAKAAAPAPTAGPTDPDPAAPTGPRSLSGRRRRHAGGGGSESPETR